jgi:pimeloyl-ACP methyl ester carboxylesterase
MRRQSEFRVELPRGLGLHTVDWPGGRPAIVLIHPNRTINRVWDHVVAASALPNRFLAPSLRGHGFSDYPVRGYKLADHRDDLIAFIETLRLSEVVLVGQATGAMLALMVAHARPEQVRAVVAANPALAIPASVNMLVQQQVQSQISFADRASARAALPFASFWSPEVVEHYLDHALEPFTGTSQGGREGVPRITYRWRYFPAGVRETEADLVNDYSEAIGTSKPVLVFGGANATVLPPEIIDRVCALLPQHERALLAHADHRLCQDNPEGFARLLDAFVTEQARR